MRRKILYMKVNGDDVNAQVRANLLELNFNMKFRKKKKMKSLKIIF